MVHRPRIVLLSGIYPPDIGGPATHCRDLRDELRRRGRAVTVVTLHDGKRPTSDDGVVRFPRRWPWPVRIAAVAWWLVANRRQYDVAYATGLSEAAALGTSLARRPLIIKVVGDQAWERARRLGLTQAPFEEFQERAQASRAVAMRWVRDRALRSATAIVAPSDYLARLVERWLAGRRRVSVVPNGVCVPARVESASDRTGELRIAFVGRLVSHKQVDRIVRAVSSTAGVVLNVVGDGPERESLERLAATVGPRVRFLGERPHAEVLALLTTADALILASDYEGLPHVVLEALAVGTPVVSPSVGGVGEVVSDGRNGLVLPSADVTDIAASLRRLRDDPALRRRLGEGAKAAGAAWRFESVADRLESLLDSAGAHA